MEEKHKGKALALLRAAGKYKAVLLVIAAGVICLLWPSGGGGEKEADFTAKASSANQELQQLEEIQTEIRRRTGV